MDSRIGAVRPLIERIENDDEDTITRHEYEHEHAYEYDARRYDYDFAQWLGSRVRTSMAVACNAARRDRAL
jgi:hypothetical protein